MTFKTVLWPKPPMMFEIQENHMELFQLRVIDEKKELDEKIAKLQAMWDDPIFPTLPPSERLRLEKQANIMQDYSAVLGERIAAFDATPDETARQ
jgi:hypothetical protein